jgi:hypothetical protein
MASFIICIYYDFTYLILLGVWRGRYTMVRLVGYET